MKIIEKKIKLDLNEKLSYFRISIFLTVVSIICIYNGTKGFRIYSYENVFHTLNKIGIFIFLLSIIFFIINRKNLKLKHHKLTVEQEVFKRDLQKMVELNDWNIKFISENFMLIETDRNYLNHKYFISESYGELIYIVLENRSLYLKSIFDFNKNKVFTVSTGENRMNEKLIINLAS
ncbi:hypothetical protein GCM10009433_04400 [Psychroflexus lacisalsi]|uniref:Uncharacterized protein n=1 Tax=Psychroflexus lacisalsi TaxID=503928 RepID=A0ABN1K2A8_9FLAO